MYIIKTKSTLNLLKSARCHAGRIIYCFWLTPPMLRWAKRGWTSEAMFGTKDSFGGELA